MIKGNNIEQNRLFHITIHDAVIVNFNAQVVSFDPASLQSGSPIIAFLYPMTGSRIALTQHPQIVLLLTFSTIMIQFPSFSGRFIICSKQTRLNHV